MHTHLLIIVEQILIKICRWALRLRIVGHGGKSPLDGLHATDEGSQTSLTQKKSENENH